MITIAVAYNLFIADRETFCSAKTIQYYEKNLGFFLDFLYSDVPNCSSGSDMVILPDKIMSDYIRMLRHKPRFSRHPFAAPSDVTIKNTTIRTYCRAVKAFLNYCNEEFDLSFKTNVKMPKDDSEEKVPLYQEEAMEIDKLFSLKTETGLRNYCIVHLMLDAGFRAEEVEALRLCDIYFDKNIVKIFNTKGEKSRVVLLCPKLKKNLYTYVMLYRSYTVNLEDKQYSLQPAFTRIRGEGYINYNCIKQLFARIKRKTGIVRLTPHLLRHTFATSYVMGGGNLENLRLFLGHYDYTVTRTYLHLANTYKMMGASIYQLDPIFFRTGY